MLGMRGSICRESARERSFRLKGGIVEERNARLPAILTGS